MEIGHVGIIIMLACMLCIGRQFARQWTLMQKVSRPYLDDNGRLFAWFYAIGVALAAPALANPGPAPWEGWLAISFVLYLAWYCLLGIAGSLGIGFAGWYLRKKRPPLFLPKHFRRMR